VDAKMRIQMGYDQTMKTIIILACILCFPFIGNAETIWVTAYAPTKQAMACGDKIKPYHYKGVVALSKDLAKGKKFGDEFQLHVKGTVYSVVYLDRMPDGHRKSIDLLLPNGKECRQFGRHKGVLVPVKINGGAR
jgi:hypothetical protein